MPLSRLQTYRHDVQYGNSPTGQARWRWRWDDESGTEPRRWHSLIWCDVWCLLYMLAVHADTAAPALTAVQSTSFSSATPATLAAYSIRSVVHSIDYRLTERASRVLRLTRCRSFPPDKSFQATACIRTDSNGWWPKFLPTQPGHPALR